MKNLNGYKRVRFAHENFKGISRRGLLQYSGAVGAAVALPVGLFGEKAQAAVPKRGGHLKIGTGQGSTTDSIDPSQNSSSFITVMSNSRLSHLTEVDASGNLAPELAESWESTTGASEWHFKLRKGVEFHNGKTLNADDVIATINHHRSAESKSVVNSLATQIDEITKEGSNHVIIKLKADNADFPFLLSAAAFGIMPSEDGKVDPLNEVGSGGYIVENFEPGVSLKLKRNPNYFKDNAAFVDSAEMLVLLDNTVRQTALNTGDVDLIDKVDVKTSHLLVRNTDIEILDVPGTLHYTFPMNTTSAPYDNNDVRLALKYAMDREEMLEKILRGHGTIGNDHPISPANRYFAANLPQRGYDPEKAKFHLKKAGLVDLKVRLTASEGIWSGALDAALLFSQQAKVAGIDIAVNRAPNDGYWSDVWMKHDWCTVYWGGRPTEDWMFSQAYGADSNWNDTFWKHARFNMLLKEARGELDDNKRRAMYGEMQRIVSDEGGALIPMYANYVIGHRHSVAHADQVAGNWDLDGGKLIERWWKT